ncbi:MAG: hypothetical protein JKY68_06830 [Rhodospirillales bacterium]|nr:hypothetical protein [Rhodospirillales bacterium]
MVSILSHAVKAGAVKAAAVSAAVLIVAACGVKSAPAEPPGSGYPHQYPTPGEKTEIGTPPAAGEDTHEGTGAPRSPLGFPLEYPNRPSSK